MALAGPSLRVALDEGLTLAEPSCATKLTNPRNRDVPPEILIVATVRHVRALRLGLGQTFAQVFKKVGRFLGTRNCEKVGRFEGRTQLERP